jgi:hypothetical protein
MKTPRAPRSKKRLSCDVDTGGGVYKGIAIDLSASGLFVQTNAKPDPGGRVTLRMRVPGCAEDVSMTGRVARLKLVPTALLTVAQGGVGVALDDPPKAYLDYVADMSPEQAAFAEEHGVRSPRARTGARGGSGGRKGRDGAAPAARARFRVHAVDTKSGAKNAYIVGGADEESAGAHVLAELGEDWQVLFVERV